MENVPRTVEVGDLPPVGTASTIRSKRSAKAPLQHSTSEPRAVALGPTEAAIKRQFSILRQPIVGVECCSS